MGSIRAVDRGRLGLIGICLAIVLFLGVNILAATFLTNHRLDLTEERLFTLSDGTRQVLQNVSEPVDLRLYYSRALDNLGPYFNGHAQRIAELLAEYDRLSGGKVRLERLDPEPFSPEEDLAVAEGVEGLPLSSDGTLAYFGLSGRNSTDDLEVIGYLAPERANFLEYDLTRMIYDLANPEKPVVAVLGDLPMVGSQVNQFQPWLVLEAMQQFFDVRFLGGQDAAIDEDVEVLMLAQPHNAEEATLYAIDQFVLRGGRVLAFVDPLAEVLAAGGGLNPMANPEGNAVEALQPLLTAWGVTIPDGMVIGDRSAAQRVSAQVGGRQVVVDYLPWLGLDRRRLNADDVVTGELSQINVNSIGSIHALENATTTVEPLMISSELAMELAADDLRQAPDPAKMMAEFVATGEPFVLAARITGEVASAFPDGPPEGVETDLEHLAAAEEPLNLILVADVDLLADATWVGRQDLLGQQVVVPLASNADFTVNALDNLAGSQGLISLRGRGLTNRPFDVVRAMEREAEYRFRATEQELLAKISETEARITELKEEEERTSVIMTAAQQEEIDRLRAEMITLRQELRTVQRSLREDVERLATWVKAINIWAVPVLIALVALVIAWLQRLRRTRSAPA